MRSKAVCNARFGEDGNDDIGHGPAELHTLGKSQGGEGLMGFVEKHELPDGGLSVEDGGSGAGDFGSFFAGAASALLFVDLVEALGAAADGAEESALLP